MANFLYTHARYRLGRGQLDLASADLRVALIMTGNTVATEQDASRLSVFTTLAELNSTAGYARKSATAGLTFAEDSTYHLARLTLPNLTWTGLTTGSGQIAGALLYHHVDGNATAQVPVAWYDDGMPQTPDGNDFFFQNTSRGALLI
jgi:hypothetical protein